MTKTAETTGPYPFAKIDLTTERLQIGARHTLADFSKWRNTHPQPVDEHVAQHSDALEATLHEHRLAARLGRYAFRSSREAYARRKIAEELGFFCIYNMADMPPEGRIEELSRTSVGDLLADRNAFKSKRGVDGFLSSIETHLPGLRDTDELAWLREQLNGLERVLPEEVLQEGGLAKATFMIAAILMTGAYDTIDESPSTQTEHLRRIIPAAYAYSSTYPIIDDTIQDGHYVSAKDKERYRQTIRKGLQTGQPLERSELPDHPLADELLRSYQILLDTFPFEEYRHFYQAGEAMYDAQERDSARTYEDIQTSGRASMYPDIFIKAAMTRVLANIIGQRSVDDRFYERAINVTFLNQFRDDLSDRIKDWAAGRMTLFTAPGTPDDHHPFADLFAYSAYSLDQTFHGDPRIAKTLVDHNAAKLAVYLGADPEYAERLRNDPSITPEMREFIDRSIGLPRHIITNPELKPRDVRLLEDAQDIFPLRPRTAADPRTYVGDRSDYINKVIKEVTPNGDTSISEVVAYALEAGGKRLRPALTLMLADGMSIEYDTVKPVIQAVEFFHTSSLLFDDLPAQDNATLRRGKPTAHTVFGEANAQLAGIAMMSSGFGILGDLAKDYPAEQVADVVRYFGSVLGPERLCQGQGLDLQMAKEDGHTIEAIEEMYNLKTSTLIEAALIPLMLLTNRPAEEVENVRSYAYHAGIVYQLRDDILDITSTNETLGKDSGNDVDKTNIARSYGMATAESSMQQHLAAALHHCKQLPFNTELLQGIVSYFATRAK